MSAATWGIMVIGSRHRGWVTSCGDEGMLAYRIQDDAAHAIGLQAAKFGDEPGAEPMEMPPGLHGVWMPSRGSEAASCGEWLGPANEDGVPAALVFVGRERAQRLIETLQALGAEVRWASAMASLAISSRAARRAAR